MRRLRGWTTSSVRVYAQPPPVYAPPPVYVEPAVVVQETMFITLATGLLQWPFTSVRLSRRPFLVSDRRRRVYRQKCCLPRRQ